MKQGNQFYLEFQIYDNDGQILTNVGVKKIVFYIGNLKKTYKKDVELDEVEVIYDEENKCFDIWLTEAETLQFPGLIDVDARILFDSGVILGCYKTQEYFNEILVNESILDEE